MKRIIFLGAAFLLFLSSGGWAASNEMDLKVTEPGPATEWTLGVVNPVKWSFRGEPGPTVTIGLQRQGWVNARMTLAEAVPIGSGRNGSFKWVTPAGLPPGGQYSVTVTAENGIGDTSGEFKLVAGKTAATQISLVPAPRGGERWTVDSVATIRWTYAGNPGQTVRLALIRKEEGSVIPIAASVPLGADGKGSHEWKVPALKPGNDYYVGIVSNSNAFCQDLGTAPVTITQNR